MKRVISKPSPMTCYNYFTLGCWERITCKEVPNLEPAATDDELSTACLLPLERMIFLCYTKSIIK